MGSPPALDLDVGVIYTGEPRFDGPLALHDEGLPRQD